MNLVHTIYLEVLMYREKSHYDANKEEIKLICEFIKTHEYRDIEYIIQTYPHADFRYVPPTSGFVIVNYDDNYRLTFHDNEYDSGTVSSLNFIIYDESYDVNYNIEGELLDELNKILEIARDTKYIGKTLEKKLSLFGVRK